MHVCVCARVSMHACVCVCVFVSIALKGHSFKNLLTFHENHLLDRADDSHVISSLIFSGKIRKIIEC